MLTINRFHKCFISKVYSLFTQKLFLKQVLNRIAGVKTMLISLNLLDGASFWLRRTTLPCLPYCAGCVWGSVLMNLMLITNLIWYQNMGFWYQNIIFYSESNKQGKRWSLNNHSTDEHVEKNVYQCKKDNITPKWPRTSLLNHSLYNSI